MKQRSWVHALALMMIWMSPPLFATDIRPLFEELRNTGENFQPEGSICEQAAKLGLARNYPPPRFEIVTNINYRQGLQVVGELDIVIFDTRTSRSVLVSEVKCTRNFLAGIRKAREQQRRFVAHLQSGAPLELWSSQDHRRFASDQFRTNARYIAIAPFGGISQGFDEALAYTIEELMQVRDMLIGCQARGECPRLH